jgi:hypothetical protein
VADIDAAVLVAVARAYGNQPDLSIDVSFESIGPRGEHTQQTGADGP